MPGYKYRLMHWLARNFVCLAIVTSTAKADVVFGDALLSSEGGQTTNPAMLGDHSELLTPAVEAIRQGKRSEYDACYANALKQCADLPAAEIFLARLLIESGQLADAIVTVDQYLAVSPEDPEGYIALGEIAVRTQRWTDAWLNLNHASELIDENKLPDVRSVYVKPGLVELRAEVAERRGRWDEAETLFMELQQLRPKEGLPTWRVGRLKLRRGAVQDGVETMNKARGQDAELPSGELTAALYFVDAQMPTEAESWFKAAILSERKNVSFWSEYLKWLIICDRFADAEKKVEKLSPDLQSHRDVQLVSAIAARQRGDLDVAESILSGLVQLNQEDLDAADQLALVLVESLDEGKRGRALQLAELNLRKQPDQQRFVATTAWVHFKLGSIDIADRLLGELSQQTALAPQTAYYAAEVLRARGKEEEATKVLEVAVSTPGLFVQRSKFRETLNATDEFKHSD